MSHPDCSDNAYALFEQVLRSPQANKFRLVWLATEVSTARKILLRDYPTLESEYAHVRVVNKNSLQGLFWFLRSRYVFFTHGVYWFATSGVHQSIVNLWHGMPIKVMGHLDGRFAAHFSFAHRVIATSEFYADLMSKAMMMPRDQLLVTGLPRNEWLLDPDERHFLAGEGRSHIIVWLPTYLRWLGAHAWTDTAEGSSDPISPASLALLDEMLDGTEVLLLLKFHAFDARNEQSFPSYRNIRIYTQQKFVDEGLNVYKLLGCADALVTDYSSIAIDFLITGKPMGFFVPDIDDYTRGFMPGVWEKISEVGAQLKSVEELARFVRDPFQFAPTDSSCIEELHDPKLTKPSADILSAVGLDELTTTSGKRNELPSPVLPMYGQYGGQVPRQSAPNSISR